MNKHGLGGAYAAPGLGLLLSRSATIAGLLLALLCSGLAACKPQAPTGAEAPVASFVGKWKSSRLATPLRMHENGEWEVKTDAGSVLQYGTWQKKGDAIVWNFKVGQQISSERNAILAANAQEFRLRETDGSTTVFTRLE
jgi:hypothetical protein